MASKKRKVAQEAADLNDDPEPKPQTLDYDPPAAAEETEDDGEGEGEEEEDVTKLLDPLSRDQLVALLRSAAAFDTRTLDEIRRVADIDPAHRKLFVHGLGWDTTADAIRAVFARYGEIDDCRVVTDKSTGRSKGYGFILFRHRASARRALRRPQKLIDNRTTACQLASAGPAPNPHQGPPMNPSPAPHNNLARKIYVGNVNSDIDGSRLRAFFARYGEIEEGPLGFDRHTGKPKGFALFVYRTVDGANKALEEPNKNFEGHLLNCQKATDSSKSKATNPSNVPGNTGVYNGSGYGGPPPDMALAAQQAAMLGQGIIGMGGLQPFGQGIQPNAAALAAMLAAAGQNTAAFGITPAMLASLNPAFAAMLGGGGAPVMPHSAVQPTGPVQGYGMGNMGYQNAGFQGPPGFQGTHPSSVPNQGGGGGSYQGGPMGQGQMTRPPGGPMGGYGPH